VSVTPKKMITLSTFLTLALASSSLAHVNRRYRGTHDLQIHTSYLAEPVTYWDSPAGCSRQCLKNSLCQAFSTEYIDGTGTNTFQGYKCLLGKSGYSSSTRSTAVLWELNTDGDQPVRAVETVPPATSPPECPVVHRHWPHNNDSLGAFTMTSSGEDGGDGMDSVFDSDNTTQFRSNADTFPWLQIDLGRNYRVTMVALLSGSVEHLMNVDIRVGESDQSGSGNARITGNTRCGIYYGPTLVSNQWVEIDCGYDRGLMGRYLTIQSTERYQVDNALELAEVEVHGWGRVCGDEDPSY